MRRTKIVCTLGPSCETPDTIKDVIAAGLDVARLNFSHGSREQHARQLENARKAAEETENNIGILVDTKGPEVRIGELAGGKIELREGEEVVLTSGAQGEGEKRLPVNYSGLVEDVDQGDEILIDDGLIQLEVLYVGNGEIRCRVQNSGTISSFKGVNVPGVEINLPALTSQDEDDLLLGIEYDVDFVAVSFVRNAEDVLAVRRVLEKNRSQAEVVAKIESRAGVKNLERILQVADGIMIARGDLGVELPAEEVPLVQKRAISLCNREGKPVITATQMLESMTYNPRPTRAEASDVANAIFDGTDAVMLSGETAIGKYPVESVRTMSAIAVKVEEALNYEGIYGKKMEVLRPTTTDAISYATCSTSSDLKAAAIITSTASGSTARMVSKYRPQAPIIAATPNRKVLRQLRLVWGVLPLSVSETSGTDEMIEAAVGAGLEAGYISWGDLVVVTAGIPVGVPGTTNLLKVHVVGEIVARGTGVGQGAVTGKVCIAVDAREAEEKMQEGDVLVVQQTDKDFMSAFQKAAAVVTEEGGVTSHAAITGISLGIPVVTGVNGVTRRLVQGTVVTVDAYRGVIYRGITKAV